MTHSMTNSAEAMMISLENVNKWYGQFHVLKDINLQVKPRERIVLCGPPARVNRPPSAASITWKSISKGVSSWMVFISTMMSAT
ncbi:ABC-type phosphate/phosphonate transport system, ATPase component [Raoultella terrigena]|uniref:ABC-type phosphate/phosphonate transport system, ATPase component n=1 Tax=Raoultella terrigena TaxID=577 RepID=A0A3P8KKX5_RAOTE|nr:ABC-type phosphate/phosphonate transport system, ATPase component [Raoultella terrigena]